MILPLAVDGGSSSNGSSSDRGLKHLRVRGQQLVGRAVSVAVSSMADVAVSMGAESVAVSRVSRISADVRAVRQGLHVDRRIAESDPLGYVRAGHPRYRY